jgi:hypothetical protein
MNRVSGPSLTHQSQNQIGCSRVQTFINVYKRLNSDTAFFGTGVKYLVNSAEQRKRDKHADIY